MRVAFRTLLALAALSTLAWMACGIGGGISAPDGTSGSNGGPDASSTDGSIGDESMDAGTLVTAFGDASLVFASTIDLRAEGPAVRFHIVLDKPPADPSTIETAMLTPPAGSDISVSPVLPASSPTSRDFDLTAAANARPQRTGIPLSVRVAGVTKTLVLTAKVSRHFREAGYVVVDNIASASFEVLAWGAGGGNKPSGGVGGGGGFARVTASIAGTITVQVGGPGAINKAGLNAGGDAGLNAAGGGGYSGVFAGTPESLGTATLIVMAGGGGGGGAIGSGGGASLSGGPPNPGLGGTVLSGGTGGAGAFNGGAFIGGAGGTDGTGGGGGGGWFGGGGGGTSGGGGGGGFSFASNGSGATYDNGTNGLPGARNHVLRTTAGDPGAAGAVLILPN